MKNPITVILTKFILNFEKINFLKWEKFYWISVLEASGIWTFEFLILDILTNSVSIDVFQTTEKISDIFLGLVLWTKKLSEFWQNFQTSPNSTDFSTCVTIKNSQEKFGAPKKVAWK
jgi:hypothetical protein